MDFSIVSSILSDYYSQSYQFDSSSVASNVTNRLMTNRDADSDGYLTAKDLPELSSDQFKQLDTDGDGKLGSSEVTTAIEGQLSTFETVAKLGASTTRTTLSALNKSVAGLLIQASKTPLETTDATSTSSSATSSTSSSDGNLIDVTA